MARHVRHVILGATLGAVVLLSGCATFEGLKTDIGNAGKAVSNTMK